MVTISVGAVTVRTALPVMVPETALMVVVPAAMPLASPPLVMAATAWLLLDQVTVPVQTELVLFE